MKGDKYIARKFFEDRIQTDDMCEVLTEPSGIIDEYSVRNLRSKKIVALGVEDFNTLFLPDDTPKVKATPPSLITGGEELGAVKHVKRMAVDAQMLFWMFETGKVFKVLDSYPTGTEFRGITLDPFNNTLYLWLEHPSFPEVALAQVPGEVFVKFEDVRK